MQFFTGFHSILQAAKKCGRLVQTLIIYETPEVGIWF